MSRLQVQLRNPARQRAARLGSFAQPEDVRLFVNDDVAVYKPNGERLLILRRSVLGSALLEAAYPFLHSLRNVRSDNRGAFAGAALGGNAYEILKNGTRSRTRRSLDKDGNKISMRSAIAGYFDRYSRIPYCRESVLVTKRAEEWGAVLPMLQAAGEAFAREVPDRHRVQLAEAQRTHPAYVLKDTPFTTITVNNCTVGAYHQDAGDFRPGFGVMAVLRRGEYRGCELVFPDYGTAVDMGHGDLVFFDPHETHGNLPYHSTVGVEGEDWERISVVMYFREKMVDCLAPAEELERAKRLGGALEEA